MAEQQRLQVALGGRYHIERELARGGMATVYLASETHPRRTVAIKVFDPSISARVGEDRFHREIELASNLAHPGIVSIFAAGEADGLLYYVMPYIEGETLRERLDREAPLPVEEALDIVRDVAVALDYAHRRGIVHRDIKPQNVLLHEGRAFVADFGVARAVEQVQDSDVTEQGVAVGTPEYMSPEQIEGRPVDARSDIYSLGCVVYELLGGEPPFKGKTLQSTLTRHLSSEPTPLRILRSTIPDAVDMVVARSLAKLPADRFPTAIGFAEALLQAVHPGASIRHPTPHTPVTLRAALARPARRGKVIAGIAVLATLTIATILTWQGISDGAVVPTATIAVRAVENLTGETRHDNTVELLTASLIDHLQRVPQLSVKDRSSSVALRGVPLTTRQFADCLEVAFVVESHLEANAEGISLKSHLAGRDGSIIRPGTVVRPDLQLLQVATRDSVAEELILQILPGVPGATFDHEGTLAGRDELYHGNRELARRTLPGMRLAITMYDSAIVLNPTYAEAYAQLAKTYALGLAYRYRLGLEPYDAAGLSVAAAERAVRLRQDAPAGYAARGYIRRIALADPTDIALDFDRAKLLDPDAADAVAWSSLAYALLGRVDSAMVEARRGVDLDKLSPARHISVAAVAVRAGRYDEAVTSAAAAFRLEPRLMLARVWWARALVLAGRGRECTDLPAPHAGMRAVCLRAAGQPDAAQRLVDSLSAAFERGTLGSETFTSVIALEDLATYYAFGGDAQAAALWVERAYEQAPNGIDPNLLESGLFRPVREDPTFDAAVQRAHQRARERVAQARLEWERQLGRS